MIKNGNYVDGIYDEIKTYIYEAFVEYYSKNAGKLKSQVKNIVQEKLDSVDFFTFNDKEYVEEYYDKFIMKYRDEILNKFFAVMEIDRDKKNDSVFWGKDETLSEANINIALLGGKDIDNSSYSEKGIEKIKNCRNTIADFCEFPKFRNKEKENFNNYRYLKTLHKKFLECVKEVERKHPCDVFTDIQRTEKNDKKCLLNYLKSINERVGNILDDDIKTIKESTFDLAQVDDLVSQGIFFDTDLSKGGIIDAFTTDSCQLLDDKYTSCSQKIDIMCDRLMYLYCIDEDIRFKFFKREDIYLLKHNLEHCKNKEEFTELIKNIKKEYEYQCLYCKNSVMNTFKKDMTENEKCCFIDRWADGHFFDEELANDIRSQREHFYEVSRENLKYIPQEAEGLEIYDYMIEGDVSGINGALYRNNDLYKPFDMVVLLDKYSNNREGYINILVHELNHSMSRHKPYEITKDVIKDVANITHQATERDGNKVGEMICNTKTIDLQEYINERQAKQITNIVIDKLDKNKVKWPVDNVIDKEDKGIETFYDLYDFLFRDFYEFFEVDLKNLNIDESMDFSFEFLLPTTDKEMMLTNVHRLIFKAINKNRFYRSGLADMTYMTELNDLVDVFKKDIYPHLKKRSFNHQDLSKQKNIESLPLDIKLKVYDLVKKKNKIMNKIRDDYSKKLIIEEKANKKYNKNNIQKDITVVNNKQSIQEDMQK